MATKNPLEMSDEEILAMNEPPAMEAPEPAPASEPTAESESNEPVDDGTPSVDPADDSSTSDSGDDSPEAEAGEQEPEPAEPAPTDGAGTESDGADAPAGGTVPDAPQDSGVAQPKPSFTPPTPEEAQQFFMEVMTPFKANGKLIELRSAEEAKQLMQMGANYTKKLQQLQPHRKVLMMLENSGMLDEGKLSYAIDLIERKDPEAIKKLLKDSGVDPLDIDTTSDPAYLGGNHQVSDEEANFRTTLDELSSNPEGAQTLAEINTGWDQASKEVLWESPEIMSVIHTQREIGVYDVIKAEVDRQKTLGHIPPNTPFLQAYKTVGDAMAQAALGTTDGNGGKQTGGSVPGQAQPQVLATRVAAPKSTVTNSDRASAASPTRASAPTKAPVVNPLAMSDDDFLKQMENRL